MSVWREKRQIRRFELSFKSFALFICPHMSPNHKNQVGFQAAQSEAQKAKEAQQDVSHKSLREEGR